MSNPGDKNADNTDKIQHSLLPPSKEKQTHVSEKYYFFPDSYIALRKELSEYWPTLWQHVQWCMAYRAEEFIERMNEALDMNIIFDTAKVSWTCEQYLTALRQKRGLSK